MITAEKKKELIEKYRRDEDDTGSPEVQISILTERIKNITEHLRVHKGDFAARRGLLTLVGRRSTLLKYLQNEDEDRYKDLIQSLNLRK